MYVFFLNLGANLPPLFLSVVYIRLFPYFTIPAAGYVLDKLVFPVPLFMDFLVQTLTSE